MNKKNLSLLFAFLVSPLFLFGGVSVCVEKHPDWEKLFSWKNDNPDTCTLNEEYGRLKVSLLKDDTSPTGKIGRVLLKKPFPIPPRQELFVDGTMWNFATVKMTALVEDSKGDLFTIPSTSCAHVADGKRPYYFGGEFRPWLARVGETRIRFPGMRMLEKGSHVMMIDLDRLTPAGKIKGPVRPPLKFLGFEFSHEHAARKTCDMYMRNFRFTDASFKNEPFYYNFNSKEYYGSVDGEPKFSANLVSALFEGEKLVLDWEVLSSGDGGPIAAGSRTLTRKKEALVPWVFLDDPKEVIPIKNKGSYWLRMKVRGNYKGDVPEKILEYTTNYDVIYGEKEKRFSVLEKDVRLGSSLIRVAPERTSLVWGEKEPWKLSIATWDGKGKRLRVAIKNNASKTLFEKSFEITSLKETFTVDLTNLKAGAFLLTAEILNEKNKALDRVERKIGKRVKKGMGKNFVRPNFPDYKAYANCDVPPLVEYAPMVHSYERIVEAHTDIIDEMVKEGKANVLEVQMSWKLLEPVENVYDFSAIDEILDYADKKGVGVIVSFAPMGIPSWMKPQFVMNEDGYMYGQNSYLHRGGRMNVFQSPLVRRKFFDFCEAFVLNIRDRKSLVGYFYIAEHCDEAPWAKWFEGWDEFTVNNFRTAVKKKFKNIDEVNKAWKTSFKNFDAILPPSPKEEVSSLYRYDWLKIKRATGIDKVSHDFVKMVRSLDPHRIIMHYENVPAGLEKYGLMTANGGCDTMESMYVRSEVAERGMPQRMEEISCSNWKARSPTQIDTSLFTMLAGGGVNTHMKMFTPQFVKFDEFRKTPKGFDRFEKFIPICRELSGAKRIAGEIAGYHKTSGRWVKNRSVGGYGNAYNSWDYEVILENQLSMITSATDRWKKAKFTVLCPGDKILLRSEIDELKSYVHSGGTLFMNADAGGKVIGEDGKDFVLLSEFGFPKPKRFNENARIVTVSSDSVWTAANIRAKVCGFAEVEGDVGKELMKFSRDTNVREIRGKTALSVKKFGNGKVYVQWSSGMIPYNREKIMECENPPLAQIAREAGVKEYFRTSSRKVWYNLLKKDDTYYLLLASNSDMKEPASIHLQLPRHYNNFTDLISHRKVKDLKSVQLKEKEVQIWRITK